MCVKIKENDNNKQHTSMKSKNKMCTYPLSGGGWRHRTSSGAVLQFWLVDRQSRDTRQGGRCSHTASWKKKENREMAVFAGKVVLITGEILARYRRVCCNLVFQEPALASERPRPSTWPVWAPPSRSQGATSRTSSASAGSARTPANKNHCCWKVLTYIITQSLKYYWYT